ncbi:hypothetical protein CIL03_12115 [Virgibacillus indicus]|uniref:Acyltransferase 3 domain-containing protein n=1 Tax=Virgibacillus indicus TaxID=2024554 RepID=A0A265NAR6_9BACI|nr:acyltransferase [Virgibacillus indicus]OZU88386.1 hypothetical protein CIL03_12115 [Virgibacillus indicus]
MNNEKEVFLYKLKYITAEGNYFIMERNYSIDFIKSFAIFAVVCIHTGTLSGVQIGAIHGDDADFIIDTFARFAVPFFFVASGYLFVQKINSIAEKYPTEKTKQQINYFKKYTLKLVKLWLAWFTFYFLFDLTVKIIETDKTSQGLQTMFTDYIQNVFTWELFYYGTGHSQYHLWFLLALIWSIIILFIFIKIDSLALLAVISLGLNIFGLFGQSYSTILEVNLETRDALFFGLFYIVLGGMLATHLNRVKAAAKRISTYIYIVLIILLSGIQVLEGYVTMKLWEGNAQNYFLATIPLIIILFMTIIKHNKLGKNTMISKIGANAVGIYVAHVFVMKFIGIMMTRFDLAYIEETIGWKLLFTPVVFILAYLMYAGIQILKGFTFQDIKQKISKRKERQSAISEYH